MTTADQPLTIDRVEARFTGFPLELRARFDAGDETLQKIWDISWRTVQLAAHETYVDAPYWEQLQYVGDTRVDALLSYALANDDRLARQAIEQFDDSRSAEGLTQSRYPTLEPQYIPPYSLFFVGMVHDFWMYREDAGFVAARLPGTRAVLDWYLRGSARTACSVTCLTGCTATRARRLTTRFRMRTEARRSSPCSF